MTHPGIAAAAYGNGRRTQTPLRIVVELYDTALTHVARAKAARTAGDRQAEFTALSTAAQVLCGLDACLDRTNPDAKPMTDRLHGYYRQTIRHLHAATRLRGNAAVTQYASVHRQIMSMREAWARLAGASPLKPAARQDLPGKIDGAPALNNGKDAACDGRSTTARRLSAFLAGSSAGPVAARQRGGAEHDAKIGESRST